MSTRRMKELANALEVTFDKDEGELLSVTGHYFESPPPQTTVVNQGSSIPPASVEEKQLRAAQANLANMQATILQNQQASLSALEPQFQRLLAAEVGAKELGLSQLVEASEAGKSEQQLLSEQVTTTALQQAQDALTGTVDPSASLQQNEEQAFRTFKESVERTGGTVTGTTIANATVEGSSAGQRRLSLLKQRSGVARQQERDAIIARATGTGFGGAQLGAGLTGQQNQLSQGLLQNPLTMSPQQGLVGLAGQGIQGLGMAQQGFQFNRGMQNSNNQLNAQFASTAANQPSFGGQLLGAGTQLGAAAFTGGFFNSDRRLKKNIQRIGTHPVLNIGIYEYDYIWGEHSYGVMADELKQVLPHAVVTDSAGYDMVNYKEVL